MHESSLHDKNCFVTLTYSDQNLPSDNGLVKAHFQNFMKRLRLKRFRQALKHCDGNVDEAKAISKIRFLHCGEYGDDNLRPHYHAIMFNLSFPDIRKGPMSESGEQMYLSQELDDLWQMGHCWIGEVTQTSCAYVARYALKKITGDRAEAHYQRIDSETGEIVQVLPEYITMSLKPGIGALWYEKFQSDVYPSDEIILRGKQGKPPRYYDKKLTEADPGSMEKITRSRKQRAARSRSDNTPERLTVRRVVKESQMSNFIKRKM